MVNLGNIKNGILFIIGGVFTNKTFYIITVLLIFLGLLMSSIFFPFTLSSTFDYFLIVSFPMLIILGWYNYSLKNSNLDMGLETSGHSKWDYYITQFISIWIIGTILTALFVISFEIFAQLDLLLKAYWVNPKLDWIPEIDTLLFNNHYWILNLFYIYNLNILVTFSIYYLVHNVIKNQTQYYILLLILILCTFIYGGMLNEYFDSAANYGTETWYPEFTRGIFPEYMFIPSLIYPYFSVNTMFSYGFVLTAIEHKENWYDVVSSLSNYGNTFWNLSWEYGREWVLVFIYPYIWISFSFIVGTLILKRVNRN